MSLVDRILCTALIREATLAGARRKASCQLLGLSLRTLERWEKNPEIGDQRRGPINGASNTLSEEEKKKIVEVSTSLEYRDLCPWKIVAKLADSGLYLASESSFYRVMKKNDLLSHRSKNSIRTHTRPKPLVATKPNEIWTWDITYLKSPIKGRYYYLYLVMDIFSRMIIGYKIEGNESSEWAAELIDKCCIEQQIMKNQLTLHSDNGGPMKGATMLATLQSLGVVASFSRPAVSDDNPFSESLFKTLKYRPSYPDGAFADLEEAREWVKRFVKWYNTEHLHSGIRFVSPRSRHSGADINILIKRKIVYEKAKNLNPLRWSGSTRNWAPITEVHLNPQKEKRIKPDYLINRVA